MSEHARDDQPAAPDEYPTTPDGAQDDGTDPTPDVPPGDQGGDD